MFSPYAKAAFHFERTEGARTSQVYVFSFVLPKENPCSAQRHGSQVVYPASRGTIWISGGETSFVKLQLQYFDIPSAFPVDKVEREIEFGQIRIGDSVYHMPVKSYYFGCMRGTYYCWMNRINFKDYRQFSTESARFGSGTSARPIKANEHRLEPRMSMRGLCPLADGC